MRLTPDHILPARILNEDDDFLTLEVAKHDEVSFTLQRDENNEIVGGDQFLTLVFAKVEDGQLIFWKPWESAD